MEFFRRIGRVLVAAIVGIIMMFVVDTVARVFGGAYAVEHHMIPGTSVLGMSAIIVVNVILSDLLGDDVLKGRIADIVKAVIFAAVWIGVVTELQEQETWRIIAINEELGDNILGKAVVFGGYISPSVAAFFAYCASLCDEDSRVNLSQVGPSAYLISVVIALVILILGNVVPFVQENIVDILWMAPNAIVCIFMLIKWSLPYQRHYEE
jgi:hypothetical protein